MENIEKVAKIVNLTVFGAITAYAIWYAYKTKIQK